MTYQQWKNKAEDFLRSYILKLKILVLLFTIITFSGYVFSQDNIHPDYSTMFVGEDKFENFNRKMYNFNSGLNKFAIKPLHHIWASIMPKYGMDRIAGIADNIEYPKRLVSTLIQKDFKSSGTETLRFLTNSSLGLGGMFDPAERFFNLKPVDEDIDQALAKCGVKNGSYCVLPVISSTTPRNLLGKGLDSALNPSCYIASPIIAAIKFGLVLNKTSYSQPLFNMIQSNYADPYKISKTLYGLERHIKEQNLERKELMQTEIQLVENQPENELIPETNTKTSEATEIIEVANEIETSLEPDYILENYNPQNAITDSMRTALFEVPDIDKSMWSELSIWNRSFSNKIKNGKISLATESNDYKFRYLLHKNKTSPLAIIIPSIGEGVKSHHSTCLAKIFYDQGYSVLILGNHFQWEFAKSLGKTYNPGIPQNDSDYLKLAILKAKTKLETKYERTFNNNVLIGTSLGAMNSLFLAQKELENNTLGIIKYIAICPPIELVYAMKQVDATNIYVNNNDSHKDITGITAAKILKLLNEKKQKALAQNLDYLPFSEQEAKLITSFIMHQKLADLIYTIEDGNPSQKNELYKDINNMTYEKYAQKYLVNEDYKTIEDFAKIANLYVLEDYLANNDNYKIYHAIDDYLTTPTQLARIKKLTDKNMIIFSNGAHLGFLYRQEFQDMLKEDIKQRPNLRE